jgi:hypothetical protein
VTDFDDFNPEPEPESQEQYDDYVRWCAVQVNRVAVNDETPRTHRTAFRAAAWLYVVSTAQIHLDEDVTESRDTYLKNLGGLSRLARRVERQRPDVGLRDLVVSRSVLDCWTPSGQFADRLLGAAKCAISALILKEVHPLEDLWDVDAPDTWSLILMGAAALVEINEYDGVPNASVIDKMNWQKANNFSRQVGAPPMNPN